MLNWFIDLKRKMGKQDFCHLQKKPNSIYFSSISLNCHSITFKSWTVELTLWIGTYCEIWLSSLMITFQGIVWTDEGVWGKTGWFINARRRWCGHKSNVDPKHTIDIKENVQNSNLKCFQSPLLPLRIQTHCDSVPPSPILPSNPPPSALLWSQLIFYKIFGAEIFHKSQTRPAVCRVARVRCRSIKIISTNILISEIFWIVIVAPKKVTYFVRKTKRCWLNISGVQLL